MAFSDSMFLCEIIIERLTTFVKCKDFIIKSQFADLFNIDLKNPNQLCSIKSEKSSQQKKGKSKSHHTETLKSKLQIGQSVLFESDISTLIATMKQYPMELSIRSKQNQDWIGSTHIPWNACYIDYLNKIHEQHDPPPVSVREDYNIFNEYTSRCMAVITLCVKLSYLKNRISTSFKSRSQFSPESPFTPDLRSMPISQVRKPMGENDLAELSGTIKTIYSSGKRILKKPKKEVKLRNKSRYSYNIPNEIKPEINSTKITRYDTVSKNSNWNQRNNNFATLVKSQTHINRNKQIPVLNCKSCSVISKPPNILDYVFGDNCGSFGNQVYYVGYFMVGNDLADSPKSVKSKSSVKSQSSRKSNQNIESNKDVGEPEELKNRYTFRLCSSNMSCGNQSVCSLDIPQEAGNLLNLVKCERLVCDRREFRKLPEPCDERILLDLTNFKEGCCNIPHKVEEVVGGLNAKMQVGNDSCYCECECKFGFVKRTTYCNICGGFEKSGEEMAGKRNFEMPFPCPIYHKIVDKSKLKALDSIGSDIKRKIVIEKNRPEKSKSENKSDIYKYEQKSESEKATRKEIKKKNDRFKFNYGYTAPHIGHSQCAMPCTGTMGTVPKNMGWLWTAGNVSGLKFRPSWKPGAVNKRVLRMLKVAKDPDVILSKKRKKVTTGKSKKPLKRPLLVVHKTDGEYIVTMETMKQFPKPRLPNQHPYEDKPLVTYTVGRTDEENFERRKKKERAHRRLERAQREFIQSAFRDMCQEICLKTYQQALGILPEAEVPDCHCFPAQPTHHDCDLDRSCSCSEDESLTDSDFTDLDEWLIEFTPPNALFDPSFKSKKITSADNSTQYSYLDYKVKLLDRYGNLVPRFFKGPDGKLECSDLGGFWGPDKKWLTINVDGFIGPDERWAPMNFIGPHGEHVDGASGKFQTTGGKWLVIGIDGYIDQDKWKFYQKPKKSPERRKLRSARDQKKGQGTELQGIHKASETTWSCFGDASPKQLSKLGMVGHGHDKKLLMSTLKNMLARGENVTIPKPSTVPRFKQSKGKRWFGQRFDTSQSYLTDRTKCKHSTPSTKGIVAVDDQGNKAYFKIKSYKNNRPHERLTTLTNHGISLSSFHVPCLESFINCEIMKKQQYERLINLAQAQDDDKHDKSYANTSIDPHHYRNVIV